MKTIQVGPLTLDGSRLFLIAGPCVIEGYDRTLMIGREIKKSADAWEFNTYSKPPMIRPTVPPISPSADRDLKKDLKFLRPSKPNSRYPSSPTCMT